MQLELSISIEIKGLLGPMYNSWPALRAATIGFSICSTELANYISDGMRIRQLAISFGDSTTMSSWVFQVSITSDPCKDWSVPGIELSDGNDISDTELPKGLNLIFMSSDPHLNAPTPKHHPSDFQALENPERSDSSALAYVIDSSDPREAGRTRYCHEIVPEKRFLRFLF